MAPPKKRLAHSFKKKSLASRKIDSGECFCLKAPASDGLCELHVWQGISIPAHVNRRGRKILTPELLTCNRKRQLFSSSQQLIERIGLTPLLYNLSESMYFLLSLSWPALAMAIVVFHILVILVFATLFYACNSLDVENETRQFGFAFNLSVQTLSTIGYGFLYPINTCGHWVAVIEAIAQLFVVSFVTGVAFAKFSKPGANFLFSKTFTISPYVQSPEEPEVLKLTFRVMNAAPCNTGLFSRSRHWKSGQYEILDVYFRITLLRIERTLSNELKVCSYPLLLEKSRFLSLNMMAELVHVIDASSPFFGLNLACDWRSSDFVLHLFASGIDGTLHQTVHCQIHYGVNQMEWGASFLQAIHYHHVHLGNEKDNVLEKRIRLNFAQFGATSPCPIINPPYSNLDASQRARLSHRLNMTTFSIPRVFDVVYHPTSPRRITSDNQQEESEAEYQSRTSTPSSVEDKEPNNSRTSRWAFQKKRVKSSRQSIDPVDEWMDDFDADLPENSSHPPTISGFENERYHRIFDDRRRHEEAIISVQPPASESESNLNKEEQDDLNFEVVNFNHFNFHRNTNLRLTQRLYFAALSTSWWKLIIILTGVYLTLNVIFAALAISMPNNILAVDDAFSEFTQNFWDGFFFCIHTMSTIGFGNWSPNPDSTFINVLVFVQYLCGLALVTVITGITWTKFAIPKTTSICFSNKLLFTEFHSQRCLMFRSGNHRVYGDIIDSHFRMSLISTNRETGRREIQDLELLRASWPVFTFCQTLVHVIDPASPLYEIDQALLRREQDDDPHNRSVTSGLENIQMSVLFTGLDTTLDEQVFCRKTYTASSFQSNRTFVPTTVIDHESIVIRFDLFHSTIPLLFDG